MEKYDTTTKITDFYVDWMKIKSACMTTISKKAGKEPNDEWKKKILICEHSPIRRTLISWKWENIPYAISTHYVRHHEVPKKLDKKQKEALEVFSEMLSEKNYEKRSGFFDKLKKFGEDLKKNFQ